MEIIWFLLIGLAAGWLASHFMGFRAGRSMLRNLIVGVLGAVVGGVVFRLLGLFPDGGLLSRLVVATVGAVILLYAVQFVARRR